jgi:thymidylate synthase
MESQYLQILKDVIESGEKRTTRNGVTYSKFFKTISFDLNDGFPLLTTKKMFWKGIVEELLFFIRGDTDTTKLSEKGVKIWEGNTSREFLDKMGFTDYKVGCMGPMYGYQWRHFNKKYNGMEDNDVNDNGVNDNGIDQLEYVVNEIKTNPYSRRIIMTDFNPAQVNMGVLYPCHSIVIQFYVEGKQDGSNCLSCSMYQRSSDLFLGEPFNIASTSLLLCIVSQLVGMEPGKVHLVLGDCHVYEQHLEAVREQLSREPYKLCKLKMKPFTCIKEVEMATLDDFVLEEYTCHPLIRAQMIA